MVLQPGQMDMHTFEPTDHSQHLADLLAQLYRLETLVQAGDREAILGQVAAMDWPAVTDEFELVVAQHCYSVEHYARRLIRNLLRPYIQYHDCVGLAQYQRLLEVDLAESPSLRGDADSEVAAAWERQVERARHRHRPIRQIPPITTLSGLLEAVAAKIALGRLLENQHAGFDAGERVPYADLLQYLPLPQES